MIKKTAALLLAVLMMVSLCSCGGDKKAQRKESNEIVIAIAQDIGDSLNPYQMSSAGTKEVLTNIYEGLYKINSDCEYIPAVAEDCIISADRKEYVFPIREGVKFHNGQTVRPEDVLYSFNTCLEQTKDSSLPSALNGAEFRVEGKNFIIDIPSSNNDFLAYVSMVYIIPEGSVEASATQPVGTGPYKFVSRSVQEDIVFEKFGEYWGTPASVNKVTCKIYENSTAMIAAINAGAIDIAPHLTLDQASGLGEDYDVLEGTMNLVQALYLNNAKAPFSDVRVRRAICYALDIDEIMQLTAEGHGTKLGTSIYPAFTKYFDESLTTLYPHDAEKAKALLAEAGYPDGFSMKVTVPSNYTPHVNVGQVIVKQLNEVGIKAELEEIEWNSWLTDVYKNRAFESTVCGFDASTLTANALLERWTSSSGKNMIGFSNTDYDVLISRATAETDENARVGLYKAAARILAEQAANAYIQDLPEFTAINKSLSGYTFYPLYRIDFSTVHY